MASVLNLGLAKSFRCQQIDRMPCGNLPLQDAAHHDSVMNRERDFCHRRADVEEAMVVIGETSMLETVREVTNLHVSRDCRHSVGEGQRPEKIQGHWVLAQAGKRVLRPGGLTLTRRMLAALAIVSADRVIEFAPGLGVTAQIVLRKRPSAYWGVERDPAAAEHLETAWWFYRADRSRSRGSILPFDCLRDRSLRRGTAEHARL